jgi:putative DNA primase/helicase
MSSTTAEPNQDETVSDSSVDSATRANLHGATRNDWLHLEFAWAGDDVFPIPRSDAKPTEHSQVKEFGKTPGEYLPDGTARGIKGWPTMKTTSEQRDRWSRDPRYSICVRTGRVGAFDIDDPDLASHARRIIATHAPPGLPIRGRSNSLKFLAAFDLPSGEYRKRRIETPRGAIELLARGQQFVAVGTHSSGARYEWESGLPHRLPELTTEQLEAIWADFQKLSVSSTSEHRNHPELGIADTVVGDILRTITSDQLIDLKSALSHPPLLQAAGDESLCSEIGLALRSLGNDVGEALWLEFTDGAADRSDQPDPNWRVEWWNKHASTEIRSDFRHVFRVAGKLGWRNPTRPAVSSIAAFANSQRAKRGLTLIRGSDIEPVPIEWLWKGWLARGKLHIAAGAPGTSKTTIALSFAAKVTRGGVWPDGSQVPEGNVLVWSGEDDFGDTLLPRFLAMGGDRNRLFFVGNVDTAQGERRSFDPATDIPELVRAAREIGNIAFVIVDPIVNVVAGDSNKNAEVRRALQPVVELAEELNAAVLGISHYTKGTQGGNPIERVTGSIAFGAMARVVFGVARVQESDDRMFVRAKSNLGLDGGGYRYRVHQESVPEHPDITDGASTIKWGEPLSGSARALLKEAESEADPTKLERAIELIPILIGDSGGKMPARELKTKLKTNDIGENTADEAIRELLQKERLRCTKPEGPRTQWVYELVEALKFGVVPGSASPAA